MRRFSFVLEKLSTRIPSPTAQFNKTLAFSVTKRNELNNTTWKTKKTNWPNRNQNILFRKNKQPKQSEKEEHLTNIPNKEEITKVNRYV